MEDLIRVALPPRKCDGWPTEAWIAPQTIDEFDHLNKAREDGRLAMMAALTVAMRARRADGSVIWGKGIVSEWKNDRSLLSWLFDAATAIAASDAAREAEQGN